MYPVTNSPGYGNHVVDGLNATRGIYLKENMELIVKLASNNTSEIGMLPSSSKDVLIKFAYQYIHILNIKEILNGIKGSKNIQNR